MQRNVELIVCIFFAINSCLSTLFINCFKKHFRTWNLWRFFWHKFHAFADYTAELSVNSSITDKCPGDVISVLCSTTNNEMEWVWQSNDLTERYTYWLHPFFYYELNIPHTLSRIQSVTTTLLNYSTEPLFLKSSLYSM